MDSPPAQGIVFENWPCPNCGEPSATTVRKGVSDSRHGLVEGIDLVECNRCDLVRTDPRPSSESIPLCYPDDYSSHEEPPPLAAADSLRGRARDMVAALRRRRWGGFPPADLEPGEALELGAGVGSALITLQELGWSVTMVEPSRDAAELARRRLGLAAERVHVCSAEDAEFPDGSFDLVVMMHVIEHLVDPRGVIEACFDWLRPGGTLIVECPNFASLESRIFGRYWLALDVPRHLTHFTGATLRALLEGAGFEWQAQIPRSHMPWWSLRNALRRGRYHEPPSTYERRSTLRRVVPLAAHRTLEHLGYSPSIEVVARKPSAGGD